MTALHPAEIAYRKAKARLDRDTIQARQQRNAAIHAEIDAGKSYRQIAAEFAISHQRVAEIARGRAA
jgi:Mor family transcriptional regulator